MNTFFEVKALLRLSSDSSLTVSAGCWVQAFPSLLLPRNSSTRITSRTINNRLIHQCTNRISTTLILKASNMATALDDLSQPVNTVLCRWMTQLENLPQGSSFQIYRYKSSCLSVYAKLYIEHVNLHHSRGLRFCKRRCIRRAPGSRRLARLLRLLEPLPREKGWGRVLTALLKMWGVDQSLAFAVKDCRCRTHLEGRDAHWIYLWCSEELLVQTLVAPEYTRGNI